MASDSGKAAPEGNSKKLTLYSYWYSSCSQRVRIALNLKELEYEYKTVNILKGEQFSPEFEKLNPLHFVPVLVDEGIVVADSFAIILYLEEKYPQHPLLPHDLQKKAINYQVANIVSSSIQPLQNLPVLNYIEEKFNADKKLEWVQYHVGRGFAALEKLLESHAGKYATGDEVLLADVFLAAQIYAGAVWFKIDMADVFLAPQIYAGAVRFKIDMTPYPILARLMDAYDEIPAFQAARPEMQPDYPSTS